MGMESYDYSLLKDLRVEIKGEEERGFCLCFWVYLMKPTSLPATIIQQANPDDSDGIPFLIINEKKLKLFPVPFRPKGSPNPDMLVSWMEDSCVSSDLEFPSEKWVHVGCEVSNNLLRLQIDGEIAGEKHLSSLWDDTSDSSSLNGVTLFSPGSSSSLNGYLHNVEVCAVTASIKDHFVKDPPLCLSIDSSSASGIEEDDNGVWSIVGGKASCRKIFSLDVILSDAFGHPADRKLEVVASLLYDGDGEPVEKPNDAEASLLISYNGTECASVDKPSGFLQGRASFKLKIAQLSSKCDNKLFRIRFEMPKVGRYPFLEALSSPICCISRNRNAQPISGRGKDSSCNGHPEDGSLSFDLVEESSDLKKNSISVPESCPPQKRAKLGEERAFRTPEEAPTCDEECNSRSWTANKVTNSSAVRTDSKKMPENLDLAGNSSCDSESTEERTSNTNCMSTSRTPISDMMTFKYCLGSSSDRFTLVKEIAISASNQDILEFAQQVSLFSGCSHHRHQILLAKRLIEDGTKVWNLISQNNRHVLWDNVIFEIEEQFMKISCCSSRSLAQKDFEVLKSIAGCREYLSRETFDKMWHWLYPIAVTISKKWVHALWGSTSLKWIEGFVTKEEAVSSLQDPKGLQGPGTFVLRFPTSRSFPHPDAGSLIVTYVTRDYTIRHRLLRLDFIHSPGGRETKFRNLQEMLLAEPELSRLGRIRSH